MRVAIVTAVVGLALAPAYAANTSHFVEKLACDAGPYGLKLPRTYAELRKIGPLRAERRVREEDLGAYKATYRELQFNGLRLGVVTYSNDAAKYEVTSAEIRTSNWKIAPFRPGHVLPAKIGDVATRELSSTATIEFNGEEDTLRVRLVGRRVSVLTYLCYVD
jgi:hypothetical protein